MDMAKTTEINGNQIAVITKHGHDYISLTDMLKAKAGDSFISDWLRTGNTIEFLGIWEVVFNPAFNSGEFATIKNQAGLDRMPSFPPANAAPWNVSPCHQRLSAVN